MKYLEEAIDTETEYGRKYIELVSRADTGDCLETHHIVPVAFFADVLGIKTCRTSNSPDMEQSNLVALSHGHHVLAHFYLAKCARSCISVQMCNAFCLTYNTTDFASITEEDVLSRIEEIDAEYRKMKSSGKLHKDGIERRRTRNLLTVTTWKDGKKDGPYISRRPDGTIVKMGNNGDNEVHWSFGYGDNFMARKGVLTGFLVSTRYFSFDVSLLAFCGGKARKIFFWSLRTAANQAYICNNSQPGCYQECFIKNYIKDFMKTDKQMQELMVNLPRLLREMNFKVLAQEIMDDMILCRVLNKLGEENTDDSSKFGIVNVKMAA